MRSPTSTAASPGTSPATSRYQPALATRTRASVAASASARARRSPAQPARSRYRPRSRCSSSKRSRTSSSPFAAKSSRSSPVGEQSRVRGIPRGLELVERGGRGRVVGRELVDDEHVPSGPRHPRELGDHALGLRDVMERAVRAARGRRRRPGNGSAVPSPSTNSVFGRLRARASSSSSGTGSRPTTSRTSGARAKASAPGARADVESALVAARLDEVAHLLREPRRAGVLTRRDALRRAGEAVSRLFGRHGGRESRRS